MKVVNYGSSEQAKKAANIFRGAAEKMVEHGVDKDDVISALFGVALEGMLAKDGENVTVAFLADVAHKIHKEPKSKKFKWSGFFNA